MPSLAHDGEQEHADHAEHEDGAYRIGDFGGLSPAPPAPLPPLRTPAHADSGGEHAGHRIRQAAARAEPQHHADRPQHEYAYQHDRELPNCASSARL